ncbi:hypothetical protein [Streptomyces iranensis]|uniref:hypothetical protein n=1 Tax=Streptomyces iranensis TaxID=576784 RepID=UPI0039B734D7
MLPLIAPGVIAAWALGGFCSSLGARLARLISGALLTLVSPHLHSLPALFGGTLPAGAGFGAVTQGAPRLLLSPAAPEERSGTLAVSYVLSYLAMRVPAVLAGLLTTPYGLGTAVPPYRRTRARPVCSRLRHSSH